MVDYLPLTGGTITGRVVINGAAEPDGALDVFGPSNGVLARFGNANPAYSNRNLILSQFPIGGINLVGFDWNAQGADPGGGPVGAHRWSVGGVPLMQVDNSGRLKLFNGPTQSDHAATKAYVDSVAGAASVVDLPTLKAITGSAGRVINVATGKGSGVWRWNSANLSAQVANDPAEGLFAASVGQNGSMGAWERVVPDARVNVLWFGATRSSATASSIFGSLSAAQSIYPHCTALTNTIDWLAIQAAINAYPGRRVYLPGEGGLAYYINRTITITGPRTELTGDGSGVTRILSLANVDGIIVQPVNPAAQSGQAQIFRAAVRNLYLGMDATVSSPTAVGLTLKQCLFAVLEDVELHRYQRGFLTSGGYSNTYENVVFGASGLSSTYTEDYAMRFEASQNGANWQHSFSHNVSNFQLHCSGMRHAMVIGQSDGLNFTNGYIKLGSQAGLVLSPDGSGYGIKTTFFSNTYFDGASGTTFRGVWIPPFAGSGAVEEITFTNCFIGNCDQGWNLQVQNPSGSGYVYRLTFNNCTFGACKYGSFSVINSAQTLTLQVHGGMVRDGGGGIGVSSAKNVSIKDVTFRDVGNLSGTACVDLSGTIGAYSVIGNHIVRKSSGAASDYVLGSATVSANAVAVNNTVE